MMKPSRFLTEIEQGLTEPMELEEGLPHLTAGQQPKESRPQPEDNNQKE
jgi:hypothetical protein